MITNLQKSKIVTSDSKLSRIVNFFGNQVGIPNERDSILLWALDSIIRKTNYSVDRYVFIVPEDDHIWKLLPILYSTAICSRCCDKLSIYNSSFDGKLMAYIFLINTLKQWRIIYIPCSIVLRG